ncbi:MAG: hypothetical protein LBB81_10435 [Treponema sp.]|nr:hypothetical protein [Treponema sp.]
MSILTAVNEPDGTVYGVLSSKVIFSVISVIAPPETVTFPPLESVNVLSLTALLSGQEVNVSMRVSKTAGMRLISESNGGGVNYKFVVFHVFFPYKTRFFAHTGYRDILPYLAESQYLFFVRKKY